MTINNLDKLKFYITHEQNMNKEIKSEILNILEDKTTSKSRNAILFISKKGLVFNKKSYFNK